MVELIWKKLSKAIIIVDKWKVEFYACILNINAFLQWACHGPWNYIISVSTVI